MDLVAGPQGSGKSRFFPVAETGFDSFNIDDRREELNHGSRQNISEKIRQQSIAEYKAFIVGHIEADKSFSIEVTLANPFTFDQAADAKRRGFFIRLTYVAAEPDICHQRVENRVDMGGHGTSLHVLQATYAASMANLHRAIREFDVVLVYDNSLHANKPRLVLETQQSELTSVDRDIPRWLKSALTGTDYALR